MDPEESRSETARLAASYLKKLDESTMARAWDDLAGEDRRRLVAAAILFGERLDALLAEEDPDLSESNAVRRFLMRLMNGVVEDLAAAEDLDRAAAEDFLSDLSVRDRVFEMNEVLEAYDESGAAESLNNLLADAVESRGHKAAWADHWTSG